MRLIVCLRDLCPQLLDWMLYHSYIQLPYVLHMLQADSIFLLLRCPIGQIADFLQQFFAFEFLFGDDAVFVSHRCVNGVELSQLDFGQLSLSGHDVEVLFEYLYYVLYLTYGLLKMFAAFQFPDI